MVDPKRMMDNPAFADGMPDICTALSRRNRIPGSSHRQGFSATRAGHVSTLFQPSDHVGIAELRVGEDNETCMYMYMYICRNKFSTQTPPLLPNLSYASSLGERGFGHFCDHGVNDISGSYSSQLIFYSSRDVKYWAWQSIQTKQNDHTSNPRMGYSSHSSKKLKLRISP